MMLFIFDENENNDENDDKIGEIFGVAIEDVTDEHIYDTCDYNQRFD